MVMKYLEDDAEGGRGRQRRRRGPSSWGSVGSPSQKDAGRRQIQEQLELEEDEETPEEREFRLEQEELQRVNAAATDLHPSE